MSGAGRAVRRVTGALRAGGGTALHAVRRAADPSSRTLLSPARLWAVDPADVTHVTRTRLPAQLRGRRSDGDWDHDAVPIATLALTRILTARFAEGRSWEDAGLRVGVDLQEGVPNLGGRYRDLDEVGLARRAADLDRLHASLARDGWLPHDMTGAPFRREMALAVGRDGRLVRDSGGLHRLILAQLLGIGAVPVRILTEHALLSARPPTVRAAGRHLRRPRGGAPRAR